MTMISCGQEKQERYEAEFLNLFDTYTKIIGYETSEEVFTEYANEFHDELEVYHQNYDIYNNYEGINNIKTINDNAGKKPVKVDQRIIDLLKFAKEEYKMTDGETNVAMGSVLAIWHDYREEGTYDPERAKLPADEELNDAAEHVDIDDVIIDEEASTVYLKDQEMSLDVGAVAKGYAVEQVCDFIEKKGFDSALVSVGGNVKTIGLKNGDELWSVGVEDPDKTEDNKELVIVNLDEKSMVTSGNYERYYIVDGKRYNHLIDKDTLYPSEYFASVTILCEDSGVADSLSTAVYNMPYEDGKKLIESVTDAEAMWVYNDGSIRYSTGFEAMIKR